MKKLFFFLFAFCLFICAASAQYAPQAGLAGSTAISATSGLFEAWATHCTVQRGFMNIANPGLGYASAGDSSLAIGPADSKTVSLGDSGVADLTFINPVINGPGPDFAVFENGFRNSGDSMLAFLELGFVEVSSDGINYFRFPANSLTQTQVQIGNGNYLNAANLNNLAGKYIGNYGTPFDLEELAGTPGLDVNNITHIRIADVVGDIGSHASRDSAGRAINDPYPTPFASSGFDLDAVGVLNEAHAGISKLNDQISLQLFPVPAGDFITLSLKGSEPGSFNISLVSMAGSVVMQTMIQTPSATLPLNGLPAGLYFLVLTDNNGNKWTEKLVKH